MHLLRRISLLLLLALWLPATQHCALEASGLIAVTCADELGNCATNGGASDGCGVLEGGAYKLSSTVVKAPAPDFQVIAYFLWLRIPPPKARTETTVFPVVAMDRPLGWIPAWQFVRRAALPSRAPSLPCA